MELSLRARRFVLLGVYIMFCLLIKVSSAEAAELRVAVASNFLSAMKSIAQQYQEQTGTKIKISSGSTGKLYAQIIHGAPFDLFFAANSREPEKLEQQKLITDGSRLTYAIGKIMLWSNLGKTPENNYVFHLLNDQSIRTLAIANPKTAPYGVAAMQAIQKLDISLQGIRVVKGENINQTWQFLRSGNADVGFIAASQVVDANKQFGELFEVPDNLYQAIEQQVVLLKSSKNQQNAQAFLKFMQDSKIKSQLALYGYHFPG